MRFFLKTFLVIYPLLILQNDANSLTNYQIIKICKKETRISYCIKNLKNKKLNLKKGLSIEIPVIPYKP